MGVYLVGDYSQYIGADPCDIWFNQGRDSEVWHIRLWVFQAEIVAGLLRAHLEPEAYGSRESFWKEDLIVGLSHLGSEVGYAPCLKERIPYDWITMEILRALREELPNIFGCVTDRLFAKFQDRIVIVQAIDRVIRVTQEKKIGLDGQLGKMKRENGLCR